MGRQDPVSGPNKPGGLEELAEFRPLSSVFMHICSEKQRFGPKAATGNTCVYTVAIIILGARIVDESLYGGVAEENEA